MLRVPSYLLRVQLEDRPGSLGSLAVALGSVGADILSLDVVERGTGYAVDDLVVELPQGAMPDMLITAAEQINGVYVDAIRPHTGLLEAHRELELIDHIAAAPAKKKLQVLADEAPRVLRVGWCTVVRLTESGPERIVGSHGAPETQAAETPWLPIDHAEALDGGADWVPQTLARHGHHAGRRPTRRPRYRGGAGPARRPAVPAVGGGAAGLSGRHRRDDSALSQAPAGTG